MRYLPSNKWLRWSLYAVAAVLCIWALAWLAVPPLFKSQVQKITSEQLGRKVTIGKVDFKPWTLELTVNDFAVATADGTGQQFKAPRLYVNADIMSLFKLGAVADAVAVDEPYLLITRLADGRWDIDNIVAKLGKPESSEPASSDPVGFSLADVALNGGAVDLVDRVTDQTHEIRALKLRLPLISSFEEQREVEAAPRMSFQLNGVAVEATADTTPFADSRKTDATLQFTGLDLAPYLAYIPDSAPVEVKSGTLDAKLQLAYVQQPEPSLSISGPVTAHELDVANTQGEPMLALDSLRVVMAAVSPLAREVHLQSVTLDSPRLAVRRLASGRIDIIPPGSGNASTATENVANNDDSTRASGQKDSENRPWKLLVDQFALEDGQVAWLDQATQPAATVHLRELKVEASSLAFPAAEPAPFAGSASLGQALPEGDAPLTAAIAADAAADGTPLEFSGSVTAQAASVKLELGTLPFSIAQPYIDPFLKPSLQGNVRMSAAIEWRAPGADQKAQLTVRADPLVLDGVAMAQGKERLASVAKVEISGAMLDLPGQKIDIAKVEVSGPKTQVVRGAEGGWMFEDWLRQPAKETTGGNDADRGGNASAWSFNLTQFALDGGDVSYVDKALAAEPVALDLSRLQLDASSITYPVTGPARFKGSTLLATGGGADPASVAFSGSATDQSASVDLKLDDLPLSIARPFYAQILRPSLSGNAALDGSLEWQAGAGGAGAQITLTAKRLTLDQVALTESDQKLASVAKLVLGDAKVDLNERKVDIANVEVQGPQGTVARGAEGRWMFEDWLRKDSVAAGNPTDGSGEPATADGADTTAADAAPWAVALADLSVTGGNVSFSDQAAPSPVAFDLSEIKLEAQKLSLTGTDPAPVHLSARIDVGGDEPGTLDYRGQLAWRPHLQTSGAMDAQRIPVHTFEPYFASQLNIELRQVDASFKGDAEFAQPQEGARLGLKGDLTVENLLANAVAAAGSAASDPAPASALDVVDDTQAGDDLLNWKTLNLRGLDLAVAPGQAPRFAVAETALSDFFARLILYPDGKLNLQGLVKSDAKAASGAASDASKNVAENDDSTKASAPNDSATAQTTAAAADSKPVAVVDFGPTSFVNGRVHFTDLLVQPNYSARLRELTGKLGAFSSRVPASGAPDLAQLELRGQTEQGASIEVLGKLNPVARPLALNIDGKVRDLELPPFSPYSIKYAGHPIERGKLNMDVSYVVKPSGELTAENNLVLTQLRFGDEVPEAEKSLPVKLAVALLADDNGVIDLDLPISGSLDNPEFSIADVLANAMGNLFTKAVTAPFTLLAKALGGGADADAEALNSVPFSAGSAELTATARQSLDKVAKILKSREALNLTVVGTASLKAERGAFQREQLKRQVEAERQDGGKARESAAPATAQTEPSEAAEAPGADAARDVAGDAPEKSRRPETAAPASAPDPAAPRASKGATPLERVYRNSDAPKPSDPGGKPKPLSASEMEALLLSRIEVDEDTMRDLAVQRGVAVRDYLTGSDLPKARLFLGEARLVDAKKLSDRAASKAASDSSSSGSDQTVEAPPTESADGYVPHVKLDLSAQ